MSWFNRISENNMQDSSRAEAPPVAFLGFCDRIHEITQGNPTQWGLHLLGLSERRIQLIYPFNLRETGALFALYNPKRQQELKFNFRSREGPDSFEFGFTYDVQIVDGAGTEISAADEVPKVGWKVVALPLGVDIVVLSPGIYDAYLISSPEAPYIGSIQLLFAMTPPLSREDIAAIESDPLAIKVVRTMMQCNTCGAAFKAYAGLERSPPLESEGFAWSQTLSDDQFSCECGNVKFDTQYMRTGLHGLLRRNLTPATAAGLSASRLYETTVLETMCQDFLKLISEDSREELVQKFLEANKIFFHQFLPIKLFTKPKILTYFVADFAILNERNELLLIEIERPHIRLLKSDLGKSAEFEHAFHQVRSWLQVLDDHRGAVLATWGLDLKEVAIIKGVVICGRTPSGAEQIKSLRSLSENRIEFCAYDDLLNGVAELVKQIATV